MNDDSTLTTVDSWEKLWSRRRTRSGLELLKRRLGHTRSWHRLLATLLDGGERRDGGVDVLEVGCAPGDMLRTMHTIRPGNRYSGVDYCQAGLDLARQALARADVPARLYFGDVRDAVLPTFDRVLSFGLIEHFNDPAEILRHHARFLAPGGRVAVTVPNYSNPAVVALLRRFAPATLATHNLDVMSPAAMRAAFERAGFDDIQTGEAGAALLPNSRVRPGAWGRSYRLASQGWNCLTGLVPDAGPWSAVVWGSGTVGRDHPMPVVGAG